jgi:hypothetical protein
MTRIAVRSPSIPIDPRSKDQLDTIQRSVMNRSVRGTAARATNSSQQTVATGVTKQIVLDQIVFDDLWEDQGSPSGSPPATGKYLFDIWTNSVYIVPIDKARYQVSANVALTTVSGPSYCMIYQNGSFAGYGSGASNGVSTVSDLFVASQGDTFGLWFTNSSAGTLTIPGNSAFLSVVRTS